MVVFIASNIKVAKKLLVRVPEKVPGFEFCGIEAEWGDQCLEDGMPGISKVFNHHIVSTNLPPCMAYKTIYKNDIQIFKSENFIISHIDIDTIFGIGWISGILEKNEKTIKLSNIIAKMDLEGYHKIDWDLEKDCIKEFEVIMGIINHIKLVIKKVKYLNYYNCSTLILKSLFKINDFINNQDALEKRYELIMKEKNSNNHAPTPLPESNQDVKIYKKKINDFNLGDHSFIVVWNVTLSIYGRDISTVKKYIPEGLPEFLNKIVPESGGQFSAAGTKRKKWIPYNVYKDIVDELKLRISMVK